MTLPGAEASDPSKLRFYYTQPETMGLAEGGFYVGHMEMQETEMKWKLETEMRTKDAPITGAMFSS